MSTPARCGTFHTPCNGAPLLMASKGVLVSVCSDDKLHMWSLRQHNPVLVHSLTPEPKARERTTGRRQEAPRTSSGKAAAAAATARPMLRGAWLQCAQGGCIVARECGCSPACARQILDQAQRRGAVVATASAVVSTAAHGSPRTAAPAGRRLVARSSFSRDGSNAATRRDPARVHAGRAKQNRGNIATDMQVQPLLNLSAVSESQSSLRGNSDIAKTVP
ncbi:unnamed protein product [Lampetra fluviatilis]